MAAYVRFLDDSVAQTDSIELSRPIPGESWSIFARPTFPTTSLGIEIPSD